MRYQMQILHDLRRTDGVIVLHMMVCRTYLLVFRLVKQPGFFAAFTVKKPGLIMHILTP